MRPYYHSKEIIQNKGKINDNEICILIGASNRIYFSHRLSNALELNFPTPLNQRVNILVDDRNKNIFILQKSNDDNGINVNTGAHKYITVKNFIEEYKLIKGYVIFGTIQDDKTAFFHYVPVADNEI